MAVKLIFLPICKGCQSYGFQCGKLGGKYIFYSVIGYRIPCNLLHLGRTQILLCNFYCVCVSEGGLGVFVVLTRTIIAWLKITLICNLLN